jgi:very-short-patch-repair endonuclease
MNNDKKADTQNNDSASKTSGVVRLQRIVSTKLSDARNLRQNMTDAEKLLWNRIRNRKTGGLKFRRQQIIEGFIADFYCEEGLFCIEVDGGIHSTQDQLLKDEHRTKVFKARGIRVLRLTNDDVITKLPDVINRIMLFRKDYQA